MRHSNELLSATRKENRSLLDVVDEDGDLNNIVDKQKQ